MQALNWSLIVPMANEETEFSHFVQAVQAVLNQLKSGKVYLVVDTVSKDKTLELCQNLSHQDSRFTTIWAPENKNVVDAYMRGYKEAYQNKHDYIIEMDAGMSHNPDRLPDFLANLQSGYDCVFGSRFIAGGSMGDSTFFRRTLSSTGTHLSNVLLGSKLKDMTSGYQGFKRETVGQLLNYQLLSKAHFYQTEVRYLLRKKKQIEIPIHYQAPSPSVSKKAIVNSLEVLLHYFKMRVLGNAISL